MKTKTTLIELHSNKFQAMYNLKTKANTHTPLKKLINKISYRILALFCTCIGGEIKDEVRGKGKELNVHDQ